MTPSLFYNIDIYFNTSHTVEKGVLMDFTDTGS